MKGRTFLASKSETAVLANTEQEPSHDAESDPTELSGKSQLAVLLGIQACIKGGDKLEAIVSKYERLAKDDTERFCWARVKDQLRTKGVGQVRCGEAIVASGLFSDNIGRILSAVDDSEEALNAAIKYLNIAVITR